MFWRIILIFVLASLGACQSLPPADPAAETENAGKDKAAIPQESPRPFSADGLYALLLAELAGQRKQTDITLREYQQQARETRDPGVVKRAALIAQYLHADAELLDMATLWAELEPTNPEPHTLVILQLVKQGLLDQAFDQSLRLMETGQRPLFQIIALQAQQQDRHAQNRLLDRFRQALVQYPDNAELLTGEALLLHYLGDNERALQSVDLAIAADKNNTPAYILKASLLEQTGDKKAAARTLRGRVKAEPHNQRLRLQYARLLASHDLPAAQQQFKILVENAPMDAELILALALVSVELEDRDIAREYFEQLLFLKKYTSYAYFYLGQISETQGDTTRATELYRRVMDGEEFFYAAAALCRIYQAQSQPLECQNYMRQERQRLATLNSPPAAVARLYLIEANAWHLQPAPTEELAVLNEALARFPQHADLLYARSMLYEQNNNLAAAETDLRAILNHQADNANALNALGYLLVNKTDRIHEGYTMITRALALDPHNAAIQDSMGWALYRLQRSDEALGYLQKAMDAFPNHEVAAHLGEVLWVSGQKRAARKIWKQGLEDDPDSRIIEEAMQRLNAN